MMRALVQMEGAIVKLRLVAEQLRRPHGFLGGIAGMVMERRNRGPNEWTLDLLDIQATDAILEVGFGPGQGIKRAATLASRGTVAGVDFSKRMVSQARRRNAAAVTSGSVALCLGDTRSLPYRDSVFDKVLGVNILYFWDDPIVHLKELRRVLKPGGRLALYFVDEEELIRLPIVDPRVFRLHSSGEAVRLLSEAGFGDSRCETKRMSRRETGVCAVGENREAAAAAETSAAG